MRFLLSELAAAVADNEKKDAALRAVLSLHWTEADRPEYGCHNCGRSYPCPTVRVITEALDGGAA